MKIFIINLESRIDKKRFMQNQLNLLNLNAEFISAVNGNLLTEEELKKHSIDYPNNRLTPAEIGCALSHLDIYKIIIERNLPYALILEDDSILPENINLLFDELEQSNALINDHIFLLSSANKIVINTKIKTASLTFYPVLDAFGAYSYIITNQAAKNLLAHLYPVYLEADRWRELKKLNLCNTFATEKPIITTNDPKSTNSDLEDSRKLNVMQRHNYYKKIKKKQSLKIKIRWVFYRLFYRLTKKIKQVNY